MTEINLQDVIAQNQGVMQAVAAQRGVLPEISDSDMLLDFLVRACFPTNHANAIDAYFTGGADCAKRFADLCRSTLGREPESVLEFASGYGRVTRYARQVLPETEWVSSDIHPAAVEFIHTKLDIPTHLSSVRPEDWAMGRTFEVVFALSFFSHIPDATFTAWLARLFTAVAPGGMLVFTTHGAKSLANMKANGLDAAFDGRGYYWNSDSDQRDLDPNDYGTSAVTRDYVERAVRAVPNAWLELFSEAFWWGHQDLYVVRNEGSQTSRSDWLDFWTKLGRLRSWFSLGSSSTAP